MRRLAAIMFTDMAGYSAAAQADEPGALARLREQEELVRPLLATYDGREVKSTGDGFLVEFDSALRATQCAIEIQRRMHERNARPAVVPIQLRIGIHLGDVERHGSDIFGDAVNIAARIEPFAPPGGICVSSQVFEQVRGKIPNAVARLESTPLKNIRLPIDLYRIALPWDRPDAERDRGGPTHLAVLPLTNISPDPKDEYFADGLTEELISVLARVPELRVTARTSVNQYRTTSKSIAQIGAELGVTSVLEGSVRKSGNDLRITVQLIDVPSQAHVWAGTYDRTLDNVFAVQREIAHRVAKTLRLRVRPKDAPRREAPSAPNSESYLAYLKGKALLPTMIESTLRTAQAHFERAVALDPRNAPAHAGLADVIRTLGAVYDPGDAREAWERRSRAMAARAVELDPNLAEAHHALGLILWDDFDYRGAEGELRLALSLNPSFSPAHLTYAAVLLDEARVEEGLRELERGEESDPRSTSILLFHSLVLLWLGRLEEARRTIERMAALDAEGPEHLEAVFEHSLARGDFARAQEIVDRVERSPPDRRWSREQILLARFWIRVRSGDRPAARALLPELIGTATTPAGRQHLAMAYAGLGDHDEAFRLLDEGVREHTVALQSLRFEPVLEPLRRDPRFAGLLRKMNVPASEPARETPSRLTGGTTSEGR